MKQTRTTWSGAQPPAHLDGLSDPVIMKAIAESPTKLVRVVMLVSRGKGIQNDDKGTEYAVMRKRHVEVVDADTDDSRTFDELLIAAMGRRTGMVAPALPLLPGADYVPDRGDDDDTEE